MTEKPIHWKVFTAVAVGIFMATLDSSIVNVCLPSIGNDFGIDIAVAQWVSLSYLITVAALSAAAAASTGSAGSTRRHVVPGRSNCRPVKGCSTAIA